MTAWKYAEEVAARLPKKATWCFNITDVVDDVVFNIYVSPDTWDDIRFMLGLAHDPAEEGRGYKTWYNGGLALSLIDPEEDNAGRDSESAEREW